MDVLLILDWLVALVLLIEHLSAFCCAWKYGLARMYTPSLLLVAACISAVPFLLAASRASYIAVAVTCPKAFRIGCIIRVA